MFVQHSSLPCLAAEAVLPPVCGHDLERGGEGPEGRNTIIAQTRDGYLWTIMEGSLVRFGRCVASPLSTATNTPEIRTKFISSLFLDHRGDLWIATDNGLVRFSNGHFFRYTTADGLSDNTVWQVTEGTDGDIWIGDG